MRNRLFSLLVILQLPAFVLSHATGADTLRIATYNCLDYPGTDAGIRDPYFRTVLTAMDPDILATQEMQSADAIDSIRDIVLNYTQPGTYSAVPFHQGYDTNNGLFYKSSKVQFDGANYIETDLRDIAEYDVTVVSSGDLIRIFSMHLKAGTDSSDAAERLTEATELRTYLNGLPPQSKFILLGDFNLYTSAESAYQEFIGSQSNNNGIAKDPINMPGAWHENYSYARIHTQSPRTRVFGGGDAGGLNDRFDFILIPASSLDANVIKSHYTAYGNDGYHFNDSINQLPNYAVPDSVANGLEYASDHLPVYCDFYFPAAPETTISISVQKGWNIESLPVATGGQSTALAFPAATLPAYVYQLGSYYEQLQLQNGYGYWLKFANPDTVTFTGKRLAADSAFVWQGWNLIGSLTDTVSASSFTTLPDSIVASGVFEYDRTYQKADRLAPGKGYWIKVSQNGIMYFSSPNRSSPRAQR